MSAYKLHYFNARGRAEPIRLCFEAAGVDYEDIRYTMEEWKKLKQEGFSPNGHLPVFEDHGKKLCESIAILKYVARELGFSPSDSFEVAQCDQICEAFKDILSKMENEYYEKDEKRKEAMKKELDNKQLPAFLTNMTGLLKSNNDGKGFFVGDKLSYADLVMSNFYCFAPVASAVEKFPELKAHSARISRIPGIKEWIKNRPEDVIPPP